MRADCLSKAVEIFSGRFSRVSLPADLRIPHGRGQVGAQIMLERSEVAERTRTGCHPVPVSGEPLGCLLSGVESEDRIHNEQQPMRRRHVIGQRKDLVDEVRYWFL